MLRVDWALTSSPQERGKEEGRNVPVTEPIVSMRRIRFLVDTRIDTGLVKVVGQL